LQGSGHKDQGAGAWGQGGSLIPINSVP
jgi:hypothetical protein